MEDRDGKKPFIIPKTHTSNKDVFISEKPDSRNVTELFDDIKSCALEAQFDFRQNECKSCDTIRNQKLQKLYNEKRLKMKKEQDPTERLAFHLITYRDVALNIVNDGVRCEQLSFPIDKYLGNPKDGVHLSRRPDVLLTSSGAQGLYRFGLLVCKVLLGKGYATIPSTNNNQLPAQLHYDHHFCKIQSVHKEQRHVDDLLANSLIYCYEHENFETISHPPQILPIAILWYDLTEKFTPEFISTTNQESQHHNGRISTKKKSSSKVSPLNKPLISPSIPTVGTWEGLIQDTPILESTQNANTTEPSTVTKYPSHFMVPYQRFYSTPTPLISANIEQPNPPQQITNSRDPRLLRTKREAISSEAIPLSPQLSDSSSSTKPSEPLLITKSSSVIYIPLTSSTSLIDPRLKTLTQTRNLFYLELQSVKHALQQQKRLNHYYNSKNGLTPKTSYTLVPFLTRQVSNDEYERLLNDDNNTFKFNKHSNGIDYSSLHVSVVDCFNFGLVNSTTNNQLYIDLEQNENKLAFEQIEISNELIQREKQLNSQQIRLRLREKRQRKMQQQIAEKHNSKTSLTSPSSSISSSNSKLHISTGRQVLKEHKTSTISPNKNLSSDLLDFFSREYKNENRPHVKHLLAELVGVFIEKYHLQHNQAEDNNGQNEERSHSSIEEPTPDDQTINSVIDMDLDSPSPQGLCDHDERFRVPTPPPLPPPPMLPPLPPTGETIYTQAFPSLIPTRTLPNEPNKVFDDPNYNVRCHQLVEQLKEQYRQKEKTSNCLLTTKSESVIPTEEAVFKACLGQLESSLSSSSSSENSFIDDNPPLIIDVNLQEKETPVLPLVQNSTINIQDDSNRSLDEFVKLLTKEAHISKSSSPAKVQNGPKRSHNYHNHRRRSHDDNDNETKTSSSNSHRRSSRPSNTKTRRFKSPRKKVSSTRTVTLISNRSTISNENQNTEPPTAKQNELQEEPSIKRIKVDPALKTTDEVENNNETNLKDIALKSVVTFPSNTEDHDHPRDVKDKRREKTTNSVALTTDSSKTKSARSRSRSKSKDRHRRQSSTNSRNSKKYSQSSRTSSNDNRHRRQQKQNRNDRRHERERSSRHQQYSNQLPDRHELFNEPSYRNSLPPMYHQHNMNELIIPNNLHHIQERHPVRHKRFNYNHQSVADHPRFSNPNVIPTPAPLMDFNYPQSPIHHRSTSPMTIGDRDVNSSYYPDPMNYSNCFDSKQSQTFERLQTFLENKSNEPFDKSQLDYSVNETVKYSSKIKSDTIGQNNNQTFTYNDAEQLLTMVQRLRS